MGIVGGKDQSSSLPRRSIEEGKRIPLAAIFIKRTAIEFLQILFGQRAPGHLHWNKDITQSDLQISDIGGVNFTDVDKRPMIIGVRGPLSWLGMGLGGGSFESANMQTGKKVYSDLVTGSVAFNCISREGVEAEEIAQNVFNLFKFFGPELRKYGFFTIKSLNIGAESSIKTSGIEDESTLVPVYITAQIQERWSLDETTSRKLRKIIIETMFNGGN